MPWPPTRLLWSAAAALAAAALLATPVAAAPAAPTARALLIGVQDYPGLEPGLHLNAPAADVRRLRQALVAAGLDARAITVMTEHDGERPTRAAVLAALDRLAREAAPGQELLVYFSGHGAQAPARHPEREPDGLEEIYLAADASGWDGAAHAVKGALADFELEAALARIEARGAAVWFVADACHAAGLTRSATHALGAASVRVKAVTAADLHIPATANARRGSGDEAAPMAGSFTGFYAAGPEGLAVERLLPAGAADAQPSSVFTFALVRALSQGRFRTLRDLALAVSASDVETGPDAAAPAFEGALGGGVLGLSPAARDFPVRRIGGRTVVAAGALEGFDPGARVVLVDGHGARIGDGVVGRSGLDSAELAGDGAPPDGPVSARLQAGPAQPSGGRGRRLLALLAPLAAPRGLEIRAALLRGGCAPNPPAGLGFPAGAVTVELLAPPVLRHCDVLYVALANRSGQAMDVSPLYVDAAGEVVAPALAPRDDTRIEPGETRYIALRLLTRDGLGLPLAHGVERLALVSAAAGPRRMDLRALAGPATLRGAAPPADLDRPGLTAQVFAFRVED